MRDPPALWPQTERIFGAAAGRVLDEPRQVATTTVLELHPARGQSVRVGRVQLSHHHDDGCTPRHRMGAEIP